MKPKAWYFDHGTKSLVKRVNVTKMQLSMSRSLAVNAVWQAGQCPLGDLLM
jgi:hypothetical protein